MNGLIIKNIDFILFVFLPAYPLLDFLILKRGFPIATTLFYIIFLLLNYRNTKITIPPITLFFCYLISLFFNGFYSVWLEEYDIALVVIFGTLFTTLVLLKKSDCYKYLLYFTYFYFFLGIAIFYVRLVRENMNFYLVRGGATFYGGNTAHLVFLFMFFLAVYFGKRKDAIFLYLLSNLNAVLFSSKGAIIVQILILLYFIFGSYKPNLKQLFLIFVSIACVYVLSDRIGLTEVLQTRLMIWQSSMEMGDSFFGTRYLIWKECINTLSNNINVLFFGCGLGKFYYINHWSYTNPHNVLMDVLFGSGIFGLFTFVYILIRTLVSLSRYRFLYLLIIIYAVIEGIALFYLDVKSSLIWGTNLFFVLCCYNLVLVHNYKTN